MTVRPNKSAMHRYFAGLAEATFQTQLGVVDPHMIDYLSDLLMRFIRNDTVHSVRSINGRPLLSVTEMVTEAGERLGDAKRKIHQHIGDFTLFWAGVYPEALRRSDDPNKQTPHDQFETYCSHGRRAYRIASCIHPANDDSPEAIVLERLSEQFDLCCYGLREVRRQWEDGDDPQRESGRLFVD